jgi:CubicO group peptidase (beta-lactamase class C family)
MKKLLYLILFLPLLTQAQQGFSKVETWLDDNAQAMGGRVVLVVYKGNKTVYTYAANNMSRRQKMGTKVIARRKGADANFDDFTTTTRQPIASCSKWLSAALVMTFVDEGKLKLTDTVGSYLPILAKNGKGGITISQCLSHTTGIKTPDLKKGLKEMKTYTSMDDAIAALAPLPMEGKPGTVFHYGNAGLQIAGAVLEKISGKSFEALFAERIAKPLDMKDTDFGKKSVPLPAGGAFSTPEDYLAFTAMILQKGLYKGRRILSEKSVAEMQVNRITPDVKVAHTPAEAPGTGYGYGEWIFVDASGQPNGTVSSPGLFGSFPWVETTKGYSAVLFAVNLKHEGRQDKYAELKKLVDGALE